MIKKIKKYCNELIDIIKFMDKWKVFLSLSIAGLIFEGINVQILALGRRWVIDSILKQDMMWFTIGLLCIVLFGISSSSSIITIDYYIFKLVTKTLYASKEKIIRCLLKNKKPHSTEDMSSGDMIYRINEDVQGVTEIYGLLYLCITCFGRTIGALIIGFYINWKLNIIIILLGIVNLLLQKQKVKPLSKLASEIRAVEARYLNDLYELIKNHIFIKIMGNANRFDKYKLKSRTEYKRANLEEGKINGQIYVLNYGFYIISTILIIAIGSYLVLKNQLTVGGLTAFIGIQGALMDPYGYFSDLIKQYGDIYASYERVCKLMEYEEEVLYPSSSNAEFHTNLYEIEVKDITFFYKKQQKLFQDFSLKVHSGEMAYITGPSGLGKTTLFKILMGIEKPFEGKVTLNINEISEPLPIKWMTYVSQVPFLFNGTIYENIALKAESEDIENVIKAAKKAGIHQFIKTLKDGYETLLEDEGKILSGGQRVRISLARAFYRQSPILLLDEVFASLDKTTADGIREAIEKGIEPSHCVLMITHRQDWIPKDALVFNIS